MKFTAHIEFEFELTAKSYSEAYFTALHVLESCAETDAFFDVEDMKVTIEKVKPESKRNGALTVNVR